MDSRDGEGFTNAGVPDVEKVLMSVSIMCGRWYR
jgi:hypothetical protein